MHKIADVAKLLGISRATAYNRIRQLDRKYIHKIEGIKHIDSKGFEILKSGEVVEEELDSFKNEVDSIKNDYIESLKNQIEQMSKELETKNRQLETKDELLKNFQVILKGEQDKVLLLENRMQEEKKSIWDRLFKR